MAKTDELQHGEAVTSKFFKGTGVFVGYTEVPARNGEIQTLLEVRAPEEDFSLLIREKELERADVS